MSHTPKWRALIALEAGALSAEGERRIRAHIAECPVCQRALAEVQAFEVLANEVQSQPLETSFDAMDLAIRREARAQANKIRGRKYARTGALAALGLVAAAAAVFVISRPAMEVAPTDVVAVETTPPEEASIEPAEVPTIEGVVVAVSGDVTDGENESSDEALDVGAPLREGARLALGVGVTHVQVADGTGFALGEQTTLRAERLRENEIVLALEGGSISSEVKTGTVYDVLAPPYRIRVQGTRFEVRREGDKVAVTLDEGIVEVIRDNTLVRHMEAPDRWSSHEDFVAAELGSVTIPRLAEEGAVRLELPDDPRIVRWRIDGLALTGGEAALTALPGDFDIEGDDERGRLYRHHFTLMPEGGALASADLEAVRRPARQGHLESSVIAEVMRPTLRTMRRCYERELQSNNPNLAGGYRLRVSVGRDGRVTRVQIRTADDLPPPLRNCLVRTASGWRFPEPGGVLTFELPLNLSATGR